jgi:ferredoxin-like protein FixX
LHAQIEEINHFLNSRVLSEVQIKELIAQCPVDAINKRNNPEIHLTVSRTKCLGFSCGECMRTKNQIDE